VIAVDVDRVIARLLDDWHAILNAWPILVVLFLCVLVVVGVAVRLYRKQIADLKARLEQSDSNLADAKVKVERDLKVLQGERRAKQDLEVLVASLREQLTMSRSQLVACSKPTNPPPRESQRQAYYDELFGPGDAIDGQLTKEEAQRLILALQETTDLMKSRLGRGGAVGPTRPHSMLAGSNGRSWWRYLAKKGIPQGIELVEAYRADVIDFANSLEAAITRQPDLEFRLRKIVGNVGLVAGLLNIVGGYIRSMERLNDSETYKPVILEMALGGPFQMMVQAQIVVDNWMQLFVERRAPAVHREAVTYL
jgi:hypothetical protein